MFVFSNKILPPFCSAIVDKIVSLQASPKNLNDNYKIIQKNFVESISKCNDLILEIGVLISHIFNAHG